MPLKIRLSRAGAKKRPFYRIVVADSRAPRDGRFIDRLGSYNPLLPRDHAERVKLDADKAHEWLAKGATPTDRVLRFLDAAGVATRPVPNNPEKGKPGRKAQERLEARRMAEEEARAATETAAAEPAEEAPAEQAPAEDAPAGEGAEAEKAEG